MIIYLSLEYVRKGDPRMILNRTQLRTSGLVQARSDSCPSAMSTWNTLMPLTNSRFGLTTAKQRILPVVMLNLAIARGTK